VIVVTSTRKLEKSIDRLFSRAEALETLGSEFKPF
jgi:hypothetical protein